MSLAGPAPGFIAESDTLFSPELLQRVHRISVEQYHRLAESGIISERTELIRGIVVDKRSQSPLHCYLIELLREWLASGIGQGRLLRSGNPVTTRDSAPEPDLLVTDGSRDTYRFAHPTTGVLAIEVAISSGKLDRLKADIYAEAAIDEYWIVYAERGYVEVFRKPAAGRYDEVTTLRPGDTLSPLSAPHLSLPVASLFPHA